MIKDIKIDKELNFASSIILYDIVAEKFNTQLSKIVISKIANNVDGKDWNASIIRIRMLSNHPP